MSKPFAPLTLKLLTALHLQRCTWALQLYSWLQKPLLCKLGWHRGREGPMCWLCLKGERE